MSVPYMLGDNSTPSFSCPHGGSFKVNASTKAEESGKAIVALGDPITPITPCPGIPPAGIPPCQYPAGAIGSSALVLAASITTVWFVDIQISTTNGFPALPPTAVSTKVLTIG